MATSTKSTPAVAVEDGLSRAARAQARRDRVAGTDDEGMRAVPTEQEPAGSTRAERLAGVGRSHQASGNIVQIAGEELEDPVMHRRGCPMVADRVEGYTLPRPQSAGGGTAFVVRCVDCGESVNVDDD